MSNTQSHPPIRPAPTRPARAGGPAQIRPARAAGGAEERFRTMRPFLRLLHRRLRRRERGAIAALMAILVGFGVITGSAALVVDVGSIYAERAELQSGADSAATAVAASCASAQCATSLGVSGQWANAGKYANANAKDGHSKVTAVCGNWGVLPACSSQSGSALSDCIGPKPHGEYVEVRVVTETKEGDTLLPPVFARSLAGNSSYQGTSVTTCARATAASICVKAADAHYHHQFQGNNGHATISADKPVCAGEKVTLVSYTAPVDSFALPQFVYDYQTKTVGETTTTFTFDVDVPDCYAQVDFVFRDRPINPLVEGGALYGPLKVGDTNAPGNRSAGPKAWWNGGTTTCLPKPAVTTYTQKCDGVELGFGNGGDANVDAVYEVRLGDGGLSRYYRVQGGETMKVKIPAADAGDLTVLDNLFRTTTGKWVKPAGC
jgi:hypothetical protein